MSLAFGSSDPLTLGVEEEVLLVDADTRRLANVAERVLAELELPDDAGGPRGVRVRGRAAHRRLPQRVRGATRAAAAPRRGGRGGGAGGRRADGGRPAPDRRVRGRASSWTPSATGALDELVRGLIRRTPECALHVHVGMPDAESAIRVLNALRDNLPLLQGLAAARRTGSARTRGSRARASRWCARTRAAGCRGRFATGRSTRRWRPPWARRATSRTTTRSSGGTCARIRGSGRSRCARWTHSRPLDDAAALAALVHALAARALDEPPPGAHPHTEAVAESSFRASRDGIERDDPARGPADAARRRGARDGRVGARPRARGRVGGRARGHRAHPARGRRRRPPARDRGGGRHGRAARPAGARDAGSAVPELILGPMLRYLDEPPGDDLGGDRRRPARSRCWGAGSPRSASRTTTTRSCRSPDLEPGETYPYEVRLDGEVRWPEPDSDFPPSAIRHDRSRGPAEDRVRLVPRRRSAPRAVEPEPRRGRARPRGRRAVRARAADDRSGSLGVAAPAAVGRRPGVRGRGRSRDARVHPLAARHEPAAGRGGRRLRGVHAPVLGVVGRPGDPVAVLDGRRGDDLRRPRRPRRLEHVDRVARGDARQAVVGGADRGGAVLVLGLPAHRQPEPGRARAARPVPGGVRLR